MTHGDSTGQNGDSAGSRQRRAVIGWGVVALGLIALSIPWFLWRSSVLVAGLPLWLWWHVGWMLLSALVFWKFSRNAWGLGVEEVVSRD